MQPSRNKNKGNWLWYIGAAAAFLLTKGKGLLSLLKFGKAGGALVSMFISVGAYALIYPWGFAIGVVLLLLVHELGHVWAAKRKGLPVTAPVFIPFLGALINMKRHPRDAETEAYVAIGGPALGTLGAVAVFGAAYALDHPLLYTVAYVGFFLNLINLLPIHPLDGGRIATAVTRWLWLVGLIGGLVIIIYLRSILFFIIWAMFAYDLYKKYVKNRNRGEERMVTASFSVPAEPLIAQGYIIPGTEHKRELPFITYSSLEDGQQYVKVLWDSLDFQGTVPMMSQGIIQRAYVTRLEHLQKEDGLHLMIHCRIDYTHYENDKYYEVPAASRWKFGIAYVLLAAFLIAMMSLVHRVSGLTV
ncbi:MULTISPECIES: site-2 protease family protein [Paenibacillus]|uniref:Zn-dependent protease n=1 Tax=Paenibacillus naphthalenovorans TaxID=162209 RepID=A0A0U2W4L1_9BACL|nr:MULTISPECIES: site-2 protease family protein [Paenibacillus]ALS23492.1 Zn-dependent protease [Paenibacillus naphthalenovorans]NTZ20594.1 site-2 protease family protein [Paenibacillus sp. JMULE4]GCL74440.1 site-2 protease family protein [Paenibacillus naphthalenovorans]